MNFQQQLSEQLTADGSITFFSSEFGETFHSCQGAKTEANLKFVEPTQIEQIARRTKIKLLDVCYGLGYNTAAALEKIWAIAPNCQVELIGLELDPNVPKVAIESVSNLWQNLQIVEILAQLATSHEVKTDKLTARLIIGDARKTIAIVKNSAFQADAIFLDPFSSPKCPQLWTVEFLALVAQCLKPDGRLATYSCAAAVRSALLAAGLKIGATTPVGRRSPGTVASFTARDLPPLSQQEEEHLQTRAAIPYRDPYLCDSAAEILQRRQIQQQYSSLEPTSRWKKRWLTADPSVVTTAAIAMTQVRDEFDSPWKDILEAYFPDFLQFFFPQIHAEVDWNRGYDFLDTELQQLVRDAEIGKRLADKLVKVWKLNGEETWVLIHIEIQSQEESNFSERMFVYYYRLRDRYDVPVVSLAILGDERETWRPQPWEAELWGCRVQFEFPTIKLLDYRTRWEELESSRNPFAIAVMAHLKTKETRDNASTRKEWKFRLTKRLYEQGYERKDILNLFQFIDWMLELPTDLKQAFRDELEQYERERQMPYVTSIEQMGIEKGRQEEREAIALNLLGQQIALETIAKATGLTIEHLQQLQAQVEPQDG